MNPATDFFYTLADWGVIIIAALILLSLLLLPLAKFVVPKPTKEDEERAKEKVRKDDIRAELYAKKYHDYWLW